MLAAARARAGSGGRTLAQEVAAAAGIAVEALQGLSQSAFGLPYLALPALCAAPPQLAQLGFSDCVGRGIYPLAQPGGVLFVVADPWDEPLLQWLSSRSGGYPALGWAALADIEAALAQAQAGIKASGQLGQRIAPAGAATDGGKAISLESIERSSSAVVRFVDSAIYDALQAGASDIHFECDRAGVRVKLRLDGVLAVVAELADPQRAEEVISRIKVLAQLDIAERRVPQDGRFRAAVGRRELDFRVSVMPSIHGEDAVLRLLDKTQLHDAANVISLASLGLDDDAITRIRRLARKPHGMLLVTGPTGSGKTTTLYAALSEIRTEQDKIITIEDPVEYELPGVLQIPVNEKKGLTFSQGLRSILRHDPDKILVGEIRDPETAEIAVQAALTGHLVFTTVHANSVFDVISRFAHMDIDLYSVMSALNGIVAQRLIRSNCPRCAQPEAPAPALRDRLLAAGIAPDGVRLARSPGCEHCRHTGYKGRRAIAEVLPVGDSLRAMILRRADVADIKRHALELGVRPLALRALDLVACGATTIDEVERVVDYD
ncbi:type II/IV secretion system protein [Rugamonas sp. FT29W]|uniref:Type II/IV secretion system protein n=2 Tax=Rugamonas aquatica TaxID=2743357 RepID=A0A6A7MXF1_9BURK|nr:type II/IV secretion system protein [Rugamonas aquatica]